MNGLTCNMKSSGGKDERWEEGECTLHRWPKLWEICGCTRPFSEFKRHLAIWLIVECNIENEDGILQGKGNHCSKLKKGKLKTKKLLKITILGEQEHSIQPSDKAVHLKINTGFHARKNP